jgi:hypothetical protein
VEIKDLSSGLRLAMARTADKIQEADRPGSANIARNADGRSTGHLPLIRRRSEQDRRST